LTPQVAVSTIGRWWSVLVWIGLIFAASSVPGSTLDDVGIEIPDKIVHGFEYAVLGLLAFGARRQSRPREGRRAFLVAVAIGAAVGIVDENYQRLIPLRDASVADALADLVGAVIGSAIAWHFGFRGLPPRRRD